MNEMTATTYRLRSRLVRADQRALNVTLSSCQRLLSGKLVVQDADAQSELIAAYAEAKGVAHDAIAALESSGAPTTLTRKKRA
jgi:hypothetical protein